jgi:hypothetical protein
MMPLKAREKQKIEKVRGMRPTERSGEERKMWKKKERMIEKKIKKGKQHKEAI